MLSLRLPKKLENRLNQVSKKEDRTKSDIVKSLLEEYLEQYESPKNAYQLGRAYFGKIQSGRADGSTNYKSIIKSRIAEKHRRQK